MTVAAVFPLVEAEQAPLLARPFFAHGDPGPIVAALAHVPELLDVAMPFLAQILGPSAIPLRRKELVILRTSAQLGCRFCIAAHTTAAVEAGLTEPQVRALRRETPVTAVFADPEELAVLQWVDAVAGTDPIDPGARAAACDRLPAHEVMELTLLVGATMMLNRFCTALDLR
jgi:AhpD family alkylhydroperoxidase